MLETLYFDVEWPVHVISFCSPPLRGLLKLLAIHDHPQKFGGKNLNRGVEGSQTYITQLCDYGSGFN